MERLTLQRVVPVEDPSRVGEARRAALDLARLVGMDETAGGRAALVATELATNVLKHAQGGHLLLGVGEAGAPTLDLVSVDGGRGMADLEACLEDGYSSAGSAGEGLGAIRRAAQTAIYSSAGNGTVVHARVSAAPAAPAALDLAAVWLPASGETVCGDAWAVERAPGRAVLLVADGLGHGPGAQVAARAAVAAFRERPFDPPPAVLQRIHEALRSTRGCAVGIAVLDLEARAVTFASIGNVAGAVVARGDRRALISQNGTAGLAAPGRIREQVEDFPLGAVLVLHSDGLAQHWDLRRHAGLWRKPAALIAGALWRDNARSRDDVTVVVARDPAGERP